MAKSRQLAGFDITETEEGYLLTITDDAGAVTELTATEEQLDLLIDALDEVLGEDDA